MFVGNLSVGIGDGQRVDAAPALRIGASPTNPAAARDEGAGGPGWQVACGAQRGCLLSTDRGVRAVRLVDEAAAARGHDGAWPRRQLVSCVAAGTESVYAPCRPGTELPVQGG